MILILRAAALCFLLCLAAGLGACTTNAATGRTELNLLSREQEIAIGLDAAPELTAQYGGVVPSPALRDYLTEIGMRMAAVTEGENPSLPWEFTLLDSDVINAFALPGGKVFISRALAERFENEAQLASVVGHEIGHVTARHINGRMNDALLIQTGASIVTLLAGSTDSGLIHAAAGTLVEQGSGLFALKFNRDQEHEADSLGLRYMTRVGYDPRGSPQAMRVLGEATEGPRQAEWLSTHPLPTSRVERLTREVDDAYGDLIDDPAYGFYERRFLTEFREPLRALPPPAPAPTALRQIEEAERRGITHALWCGVCREAAPGS